MDKLLFGQGANRLPAGEKEMCPRFGTCDQCDCRVVCQGCTPPSDEQIARRRYIPCCRADLYKTPDTPPRWMTGNGPAPGGEVGIPIVDAISPPVQHRDPTTGLKRYIVIPREYTAAGHVPSCDVFVKPGDVEQFENLLRDAKAGDRLQVFYMGRV